MSFKLNVPYLSAISLVSWGLASISLAQASRLIPAHSAAARFNQFGELNANSRILENRYDAFGRMNYSRTETSEQYYGYDADGRRTYMKVVERSNGTAATSLFPNQGYQVQAQQAVSFVLLQGHRLARIDHEQKAWFYYLKDHLESSDYLMTADGKPVEQALYRPYGQERNPLLLNEGWAMNLDRFTDAIPWERMHHRFTDHYLDDATGLYYFNARYYDTALGTFTSPDTYFVASSKECLTSPLECNLYSYAANNPLKFVDRSGEKIEVASLFVDRSEYNSIMTQLKQVPQAAAMIDRLEKRPEVVTVFLEPNSRKSEFWTQGKSGGMEIHFDPYKSVVVDRGGDVAGVIRPGLVLVHEIDHAMSFIDDSKAYLERARLEPSVYKSAEERRVINGMEKVVATALGEPIRESHSGVSMNTPCALCRPREVDFNSPINFSNPGVR